MSKDKKPKRVMLPFGTVLDDRFEIQEWLGAGSFGAVYRAKQLVFGHPLRDVALKLFDSDKVSRSNVRDLFSDAITLIGLQETEKCPLEVTRHMVQVYDIGILKTEQGDQAFMSMKLVPGRKTLESAVRRWRHAAGMPVATSLRFLLQILVPLAWMHTLDPSTVHGDLKPDNVLLAPDSTLILTDFGLASRLPLASLGGAVQYQAPETLLGGGAETSADIYGVGLMWYEMLTGRQPFSEVGLQAVGDDDTRALVRSQQEARKWLIRPADPSRHEDDDPRVPLPSETNEELRHHPKLEEMLKRCLAYRQSDRYANARLLLEQIDKYLQGDPSLDVSVTSPKEAADVVLPKETPEMLLENARVFLERGEPAKARSLAEELLRQDPKSVPGLLALARAQAASGQPDHAKETLTRAQQLDREGPEVFEAMADMFQAMNKPDTAKSLREQATKLREKKAQAARRR